MIVKIKFYFNKFLDHIENCAFKMEDDLSNSAHWKTVPSGIEINIEQIPTFIIHDKREIEYFFQNIGLYPTNLSRKKGYFDIRCGVVDFIPEESKKKFLDELKQPSGGFQ